MSCGKRPLIKSWDKPRIIRKVTPSRYEQNEASVKVHWRKVVRDLELSYKDDQFWESQTDTVRELVGPAIFQKIAKIYNLPLEATKYQPCSDTSSPVPSEQFYRRRSSKAALPRSAYSYSMSDFEPSVDEDEQNADDQSEQWSVSSIAEGSTTKRTGSRMKSFSISKSALSTKPSSKFYSKTIMKSFSSKKSRKSIKSLKSTDFATSDESTHSSDDLKVNYSRYGARKPYYKTKNPHHNMLYCNESETDMIKWNSKYKQKTFEVSASDEFTKKAEIITKKISIEFYEWWVGLGNLEFKSEIRRPEDIEALFQVWFDEHASRGLVLHPKILPCVLESIAKFVGVPKAACPKVLKRQIAYDVHAETSPAHVMAFGTCLPHKMKHLPPKNNTKEMWDCVHIPEDLRTMSCVWDDVAHLTSTKAFKKWLQQHPHLPMPECLKPSVTAGVKKQPFVVPSDFVVNEKASSSAQELALPVSQFSMELKEVLSKLMNH